MILESMNDFLFLVDFFTIILPALTAIGVAFLCVSAAQASIGERNE